MDSQVLFGLAALVSALGSLVWAFQREQRDEILALCSISPLKGPKRKSCFSTRTVLVRQVPSGGTIMFLTNQLWLTALATLISSLATLVWAARRKR